MFQEKRRGRFAICPGDTNDFQPSRWMAVERAGQLSQRPSRVFRDDRRCPLRKPGVLANDRNRAFINRLFDKRVAIELIAFNRNEQIAWCYPARIVADSRNLAIDGAAHRDDLEWLYEI